MCGRFTSTFEFSDVRVRWNLDCDLPKYTQRFNVAPETSPDILVIIRRNSIRNYFQGTGIFPITHTLVMHERKISQYPWLCEELVTAFNEADRRCRLEYEYPKRFSFPTAVLFLEEEEQQFGGILGHMDWTLTDPS